MDSKYSGNQRQSNLTVVVPILKILFCAFVKEGLDRIDGFLLFGLGDPCLFFEDSIEEVHNFDVHTATVMIVM